MQPTRRLFLSTSALLILSTIGAPTQAPSTASIQLWATKEYSSWDNPLQSEVTINGKLVNIFTSEKMEPIGLKDGWNVVIVKTTPQEPASKNNGLIFRIGPTQKDPKNNKVLMAPVLWEFRNGTDWRFENGKYSHPLGPGTKDVTQTYNFYYTGLQSEARDVKAGDYVLTGDPDYDSWNVPVIGTVFINGTPLNSFNLPKRQIVITSLLKDGRNEIKLVSTRVKNSIKNNDIAFQISGPAEWNVTRNQFVTSPVTSFKTMQGWTQDAKSGQLINKAAPDAETIERVIPFVLKK